MQVTADISKMLESAQSDLTFVSEIFSELRIGFVSFLVILAPENVVSFTKTCFYQKRSRVTMRNYVEEFDANIGHNLA